MKDKSLKKMKDEALGVKAVNGNEETKRKRKVIKKD